MQPTEPTLPPTTRDVTIRINNRDRHEVPERPWAAAIFIDGEHGGTAAFGDTPLEAFTNLLTEYDWTEELA